MLQPTTNQAFVSTPLRPEAETNEEILQKFTKPIAQAQINDRIKTGTRPTALKPENPRGQNKAAIEIHQRGLELSNKDTLVGSFYDFILGNVQETDAEKVSVMETFGDPHIFASGRFLRKYTFAGVCRATPQNWNSSTPSMLVSQFLSFRVFYDKYLRASEQVKNRRFTRVVVDGDMYEGWVTTMNLGRAAENEQMVPFTFTLYGVKRSHTHESQAETLLAGFRPTGATKRKFDFARAKAALKDSLGDLELSLHRGLQDGEDRDSLPVTTETDESLLTKTIAYLRAVGSSQILSVSMPAELGKAISLEYGPPEVDNVRPVSGSLATTTTEKGDGVPLILRVLSIAPFLAANPNAEASAKSLSLTVPITISAATGSSVTLSVTLAAKVGTELVLDTVQMRYLRAPQMAPVTGEKISPSPAVIALADVPGADAGTTLGVIADDNAIPFELTLGLKATKGILVQDWFEASTALGLSATAEMLLENGSVESVSRELVSKGTAAVENVVPVGSFDETKIVLSGRITLPDFSLSTPRVDGNHIQVTLVPKWTGKQSTLPDYKIAINVKIPAAAISLSSKPEVRRGSQGYGPRPSDYPIIWGCAYEIVVPFSGRLSEAQIRHIRANTTFDLTFDRDNPQAGLGSVALTTTRTSGSFRTNAVSSDQEVQRTVVVRMGGNDSIKVPTGDNAIVMERITIADAKIVRHTHLRTFIYLGIETTRGTRGRAQYSDSALVSERLRDQDDEQAARKLGYFLSLSRVVVGVAGISLDEAFRVWAKGK